MLKPLLLIIIFIVSFIGCTRKEDLHKIETKIINLQKKDSVLQERSFKNIKIADALITENPLVSDSLKQINDYFLGDLYKTKGQLDSTALYFTRTTDYVGDTIKTDYDRFYFYNAFANLMASGKYGDAKTIADSFKKRIDTTSFTKNTSYYYYFSEEYYKSIGKYEKALEANKQRVFIIQNWEFDSNTSQELLAQSELLKGLGRNTEAEKVIEFLIANDSLLTLDLKRQVYNANGVLLFKKQKFYEALENYKKTLLNIKLLPQYNKQSLLANCYSNIAETYIELKLFDTASKYLDSARGENIERLSDQTHRNILLYELRLAYKDNEPISKIEAHLSELLNYQNITYKNKFESELIALKAASIKEEQLLIERQENEVKRLNDRNNMLFIIGSLFLLLMGLFSYSRNKKLKFDKQTLQMQQRLLRSQMNPHFTFNTLSSIQNSIKSDPVKAQKHILKFSRLLRLILENSTNNFVQFNKEIEALKKFMDLQILRFPDKFNYSFNYNNMDEEDLIFIPPMLLQPFIENSIEHGFMNLNYLGEIHLEFTLNKNLLYCRISDNGTGITTNSDLIKESLSTKLITDYLKKETRKEVLIIDKKKISNETGTIVTLAIPYKHTDEN